MNRPSILDFVSLALAVAMSSTTLSALAVTIDVSPNGPIASLHAARDAVRQLKAQGPLVEPVRVVVAPGRYRLTEPLVLSPEDSGTAECPIVYEAATGAVPVFTGGRTIRGFQPGPDPRCGEVEVQIEARIGPSFLH